MAKAKFRVGLVILVTFGGMVFWQRKTLKDLRNENSLLEARALELQKSKTESERLLAEKSDPAKAERIKKEQAELLRLRDEVGRLRRKVQQEQAAAGKEKSPAPASDKEETQEERSSPVDTYISNVRAVVALQQTLVTGGWKTQNGKRLMVFIQPSFEERAGELGQVMIKTRLVELPEEVMTSLGLADLRSEGKQSSSQMVLSTEQSEAIFKSLEQTTGVDILGAPRVITANGRQAQVSVSTMKTLEGQNYELGPMIDILPQVSPDRNSIDLSVTSQMRFEAGRWR